MSAALTLPDSPAGEHPAVLVKRAALLVAMYESIGKSLAKMLTRQVQFVDTAASYKTPAAAFDGLGEAGRVHTLYDVEDKATCAVATDQVFATICGALLMRMTREVAEERIQKKGVDGLLYATGGEVINVVIGQWAKALAETLRNPRYCFPRDEPDDVKSLGEKDLLVVAAAALVEGHLTGRLELWIPDALAAKIR
jgi:hypothetical protein